MTYSVPDEGFRENRRSVGFRKAMIPAMPAWSDEIAQNELTYIGCLADSRPEFLSNQQREWVPSLSQAVKSIKSTE
jgi:hypothetical protein